MTRKQDRLRTLIPPVSIAILLAAMYVAQHWFGLLAVRIKTPEGEQLWPLGMTSLTHLRLGRFSTLITHLFAHQSLAHLLFNVWPLLQFGPEVVRRMGAGGFFRVYLIAGVCGALLELGVRWLMGTDSFLLGASGAICGVVAAHLRMHPKWEYSVLFFRSSFTGATLLWVFVAISFAWAMLDRFAPSLTPGWRIAHFAHIGGWLWGWFCASKIPGIKTTRIRNGRPTRSRRAAPRG